MCDDPEPERLLAWHKEGLRHLAFHADTGDTAALARARELFALVVTNLRGTTPDRDVHLHNLATSEYLTYLSDPRPGLLAAAIRHYRQAITAAADSPHQPQYEYGLARCLLLRHQQDHDPEHLDEAAGLLRGTLQHRFLPPALRPQAMLAAAAALKARHSIRADQRDLAECVELYRSALRELPETDRQDRATAYHHLGLALAAWHDLTDDPEAAAEAIRCLSVARASAPPGDAWQTDLFLANRLAAEHRRTGRLDHLDEAIVRYERLLAAVDSAAPDWTTLVDNLCTALQTRGTLADLHRAAEVLRHGQAVRAEAPTISVVWTLRLGQIHRDRHELTGDLTDLDRAVNFDRAAVDHAGTAGLRQAALRELATSLLRRHQRSGAETDLTEAIERYTELLAAPGLDDRSGACAGLAEALLSRHRTTGDLADLDHGTTLLRAALAGPGGDPNRPAFFQLTGEALLARYRHTGEISLLDEAADAFRRSAAASGPIDVRQMPALLSLGEVLLERYERTGNPDTGDEAVATFRHGLAQARGQVDERASTYNLATALRARYEHQSDLHDLIEAADLLRGLVAPRLGGTEQVEAMLAHTEVAYRLYRATGESGLLKESLHTARAAARVDTVSLPIRLRTQVLLGQAYGVNQRWEAAGRALREAVRLLPRLANRNLSRSDQQYALGRHPGLAAEAAAYALEAGAPEQALEVLEQGRGVLLARRLQTRDSDLDQLTRVDPALAAEFLRLREAEDEPLPRSSGWEVNGEQVTRRRAREAEWQRLIAKIRAQPGMADFLRPPAAEDILRQAGDAPIAIINISIRCDAIIVHAGRIEVVRLWLTAEQVQDVAQQFLAAVDSIAQSGQSLAKVRDAQQAIAEILEWLWDRVTEPVLRRLGITDAIHHAPPRWHTPAAAPPHRVWWCPQGILAFLPLHAAGYHRGRRDTDQLRNVLDLVVSSYTPTIGALHHARARSANGRLTRPLVVTAPEATSAAPLTSAVAEADVVRETLRDMAPNPVVLSGSAATRDRVLTELANATSAHFACHAIADPHDPARSRLLIHNSPDQPLTVADVSALRLSEATLAYLSACATTRTRQELADEAIHITGGFLLAGYRHVVGTLWPVVDALSPQIAQEFYAGLAASGYHPDAAAAALNAALRRTRDRFPLFPSLWSSHVHLGP